LEGKERGKKGLGGNRKKSRYLRCGWGKKRKEKREQKREFRIRTIAFLRTECQAKRKKENEPGGRDGLRGKMEKGEGWAYQTPHKKKEKHTYKEKGPGKGGKKLYYFWERT